MRLFFGIFPPDPVVREAAGLRDRARLSVGDDGVRWVEDAQIHLTLQFLGELDEVRAGRAAELAHLVAGRARRATLRLEGYGVFPNERRPHVLWLGVSGETDRLVALADDLGSSLRSGGFALDDRKYHPHVTVARIKGPARRDAIAALRAERVSTSEFVVDRFMLVESKTGPRGSVYAPRATFELS